MGGLVGASAMKNKQLDSMLKGVREDEGRAPARPRRQGRKQRSRQVGGALTFAPR
jgi:hypothetical protein